ncbi:hypothetical protein [Desulfosarcina ovata]|uniref:Uncharacterized protein n=2 Tax=Desulfosarcina ovata TaxID=83564 RepID=A0A5K8AAR2_9BACT|nr:hypothetical protein [Desulfosarcina ovata]BBO82417.1 hypothetical protein DSCO28_29830 [Desulfosarcina ovata subsp. sediminis]BBO89621.1 hypothetical protein DSCOOX_28010 [Desulfosarcina ovata subsp. ovata]
MKGQEKKKENVFDGFTKNQSVNQRSGMERRHEHSNGFTYVSTVGWICRREQSRRKTNDNVR